MADRPSSLARRTGVHALVLDCARVRLREGVRALSLVREASHCADDRGDQLTEGQQCVHHQRRDDCGRCCRDVGGGGDGDGRRRRTGRGPVVDGCLPLQCAFLFFVSERSEEQKRGNENDKRNERGLPSQL